MKIKKIICAAVVSVMTFSTIFATDLKSVCESLAKHTYTTGNFSQVKTIKANNRSLKSSGTFILGVDGIVWNTLKPVPSAIAVTNAQIIQTARDGSQTVIKAEGNEVFGSIANTLTAVFSNDLSLLNANFNIEFSETKNDGKWHIALTPKDSAILSVMKTLLLEGSSTSDSATLESITMTENSDNTITYTFTDQKYPKELTADEKAFFVAK